MRHRPAIDRPPDSRAFVDGALADLRRRRWSPDAWAAFLWRCGARSAEQALAHPRAALEVTALHLALPALSGRSDRRVTASWALAITHLGLLGPGRRSIAAVATYRLRREREEEVR